MHVPKRLLATATLLIGGAATSIWFTNCSQSLPDTTIDSSSSAGAADVKDYGVPVLAPASAAIDTGAQINFVVTSGGKAPFSYSLKTGEGTIDAASGFFIAPTHADSVTVEVLDSAGKVSDVVMTVRAPVVAAAAPATVQVQRYYFGANFEHAIGPGLGGSFVAESTVYKFLAAPGASGTRLLYRCIVTGSRKHFVTADVNCEGQTQDATAGGPLGSVYTALVAGTVPLYRLYNLNLGDHMVSTNSQEGRAQGYALDSILGYIPSP